MCFLFPPLICVNGEKINSILCFKKYKAIFTEYNTIYAVVMKIVFSHIFQYHFFHNLTNCCACKQKTREHFSLNLFAASVL